MSTPLDDAFITDQLRYLIDPEVGLNIVDLGMVTSVTHDDAGRVTVILTPTSPACPMHEQLTEGARMIVEKIPGVTAVDVQMSFNPPWNLEWITPAGREFLEKHH